VDARDKRGHDESDLLKAQSRRPAGARNRSGCAGV